MFNLILLPSDLLCRFVDELLCRSDLLLICIAFKLLRLDRAEHPLDVNLCHFECLLDSVSRLDNELLLTAEVLDAFQDAQAFLFTSLELFLQSGVHFFLSLKVTFHLR